MAFGQVTDMDVVAHAGTVRRRIVLAKNGQVMPASDRDLRDVRHQIVGRIGWILADQAGRVGTGRVEIAQDRDRPVWIGGVQSPQHVLDDEFGVAIDAGGRQRMVLGDRQLLRFAIDGRRR